MKNNSRSNMQNNKVGTTSSLKNNATRSNNLQTNSKNANNDLGLDSTSSRAANRSNNAYDCK